MKVAPLKDLSPELKVLVFAMADIARGRQVGDGSTGNRFRENSLFAKELVPSTRVLFINANVYDGSLQPRFLAQVVVERNVIVRVEAQTGLITVDNLSDEVFVQYITQYDQVFDLRGNTLMPGLVEGHAHISFPDSFDFAIPPEEHTLIAAKGAKKLLGK